MNGDEPKIIIIGSGAGGATMAHELCDAGHQVMLLEAGPRIEPTEFHQNDLAAFEQLSWLDARQATGDWEAARFAPDRPAWTVKALGGTTLHWNALAYRMQPHEFRPLTTYGKIEGSSLIDWPLSFADLAPYYSIAEDRMGVTGTHGIARHPATNNYKVLYNGARRAGYSRIDNGYIAINSSTRDSRPGCIQMGFCNQGCIISAKWSAAASEIVKAEATGRLDLQTEAMVTSIEHDATGAVNAVIYRATDGSERRVSAAFVILAAGSIESARLLLLSASNQFPDGLGNRSGHVGRHYMRHIAAMTFAEMPGPVNMHRGIVTPGTIFDEDIHDPGRGFAGGYLMEAAAVHPVSLAMLLEPGGWGKDYTSFLERYDHLAGMLMNGEELPRADNRVTLSTDLKDAAGQPAPHVHVDEHPQSVRMRRHYQASAERVFNSIGALDIRHSIPPSAAHNMGTCRMSDREEDGVTDINGKVHGIDNLYIADGSTMVSSGAENPTLTIVALALRQAEYLKKHLKRI